MKTEFINKKGISEVNEDSYLVSSDIWGVFDGANSLNQYFDSKGNSGGKIASLIAKKVFERNNKPLRVLAIEANNLIRDNMVEEEIDLNDKLNLWCSNLAVVRLVEKKLEWIQLSDATIIFLSKNGTYEVIRGESDYDNEYLIKWKSLADQKTENIRQILDEDIKKVRRKINITYGFLTGEDEMPAFLREGKRSIVDLKSVILFTDGFYIPKKDPVDDDNWDLFIKLYKEGGINKIGGYIRNIENSDSNCWEFPRGKKHDDMTAISIDFD